MTPRLSIKATASLAIKSIHTTELAKAPSASSEYIVGRAFGSSGSTLPLVSPKIRPEPSRPSSNADAYIGPKCHWALYASGPYAST
eukprot:CAMPEP_0182591622 /NCGR_PEP_ID=MMETSP1324-20130603/74229_1 /TAXON_ID=236786 /ORGANISM="Florenciella sp., Strain RCC1587" /LENGTH=85 /DNA_ID=CAMNT_0024808941 /DNA_START=75 /DNA_END=329 /DNA_ORIENTATION=-